MAQETAVHRWDAERTVGDVYEIPIALAAEQEVEIGHDWREGNLPGRRR
jgi:hypothetical protein